jgi:Arc/MetJ family transcription regulator
MADRSDRSDRTDLTDQQSGDVEAVDEALLAQAGRALGTRTPADTINSALAAAVARGRQDAAVAAELRRYESGHYARLAAAGGTR